MSLLQLLSAKFGGNADLSARAFRMIHLQLPQLRGEIHTAIQDLDHSRIGRAAHDVKNALAYLDQAETMQMALALESVADRAGSPEELSAHWQALEPALQTLCRQIEAEIGGA